MLSEETVEKLTERLARRVEKVNTEILKQIARTIDEIGKLTPTETFRLGNILKYGGDYNKIIKQLRQLTNLNTKEIEEIIDELAKKNYLNAKQLYQLRNIGYIPFNENMGLIQQVNAIKSVTLNTFENISRTNAIGYSVRDKEGNIIFKDISSAYRDAIDEAVMSIYQGKEDFEQVSRRIIKDFGNSGLKYVDYENGRTNRLDSAIRMNVQGAIRDLENAMQLEIGKQINNDGVEISVHANPAPDHEDIQGHQFTLEEFNKMQNSDAFKDVNGKEYEPIIRHIGEWNCYHIVFSIKVGINKPQYTQKQLNEIIKNNNDLVEIDGKKYTKYECTQLQRKLETEIRKQKDIQIMAREINDDDTILKSQNKIQILTKKYKELSELAGLKTKMQRLSISGYRKVKTK